MHQKLKELTDKQKGGNLTGNNLRNRAYSSMPVGPFDPDAAIVVEEVSAGEKMGDTKDAWLESKKRASATGTGASAMSLSSASGESKYQKKAEDTVAEPSPTSGARPTFDTDGKIGGGGRGALLAGLSAGRGGGGPGGGRGNPMAGGLLAGIQGRGGGPGGGRGNPMAGGLLAGIQGRGGGRGGGGGGRGPGGPPGMGGGLMAALNAKRIE